MTVVIDTSAEIDGVRFRTQAADPAAPAANHSLIYQKADGLYLINSAGLVTGPMVGGWIPTAATWTFSSADDPTFVISVNADVTAVLSPGMRLRLTHAAATKYFIVTAVGVFGAGVTLVTVYGGTDYDLAAGAITNPFYSRDKAPFGFPLDPRKWTVEYKDSAARTQLAPVSTTWYNINAASIDIPIGIWFVEYKAILYVDKAAAIADLILRVTLSTANNNESDTDFTWLNYANVASASQFHDTGKDKILELAAKATYYLNSREDTAGWDFIRNDGTYSPTIIRAVSIYV